MRIFILLTIPLILSSCVAKKKVDELSLSFQEAIKIQAHTMRVQQDSIITLALALERSRGSNDALLITQDKLQDRLAIQEDELDNLEGNLSSTSSRMRAELEQLKTEKAASEAAYDTLLFQQGKIIAEFQYSIEDAANVIAEALDTVFTGGGYSLTISAGDLIFSVREEVIFKSRTNDRLTDEAEPILRAVLYAIQADPLLKLTIIGHTDNQPNPRRGVGNWEYAALRATVLAEELANTYYLSPNRVVAAGHGEFAPIQSNATAEGRAANRRIDFVLQNNTGNLLRALGRLKE